MTPEYSTATLGDYWRILRGRWRLIVASAVVGAIVAGAYLATTSAQYSASASVIIRSIQADPLATTRTEDVGASTERSVMASSVVAERASRKLDSAPARSLLGHLTVDNPVDTLILDVTFTADSPELARDGAQAFADSYLEYREAVAADVLSRRLAQIDAQIEALRTEQAGADDTRRGIVSSRIGDLELSRAETAALDTTPGRVIQPAELPESADGPGSLVTLAGGLALGALVGVGLALFLHRRDRRVVGSSEVRALVDDEHLVVVPHVRRGAPTATAPWIACAHDVDGLAATEYRRLRFHLWPQRGQGPSRVLVVAPASRATSDEVAVNLGVALSSAGWQTVLGLTGGVERGIEEEFDAGTVHAARAATELGDRLVELDELPRLAVLPGLGDDDGATDLARVERDLEVLSRVDDVQLVAADSMLTSMTPTELCEHVDGVILAFDTQTTDRDDLGRALQSIRSFGKILAVVGTNAKGSW